MFENESCNDFCIKNLNKYLCNAERLFIRRLYFWSSHSKSYGIKKEGRVWIYNTLDQWAKMLSVSKSSVRRIIKSLKDKKIIDSNYLSKNKRNRTLYYSINFDVINEYLSNLNTSAQKTRGSNSKDEHIDEHMYIMDNSKHIINKSYKSIKNKIPSNDFWDTETNVLEPQKPTIIQDMLKIWKEEFQASKIEITKNLARFLVSAFKTKFKSSLKEWKRYLKTLKTSVYLMSKRFKLSIWWVIKFITIDRIRAGELGVNENKLEVDKEELSERLNQHIENLDETESCKKLRYKIIDKLSLPTYLSWFTRVNFVEADNEKIVMKTDNKFVEDWVMRSFADQCGLCLE